MRFLLVLFCALPSQAAERISISPHGTSRGPISAPLRVPEPDFSVPLSETGLGFISERWTGSPSLERGNAVALTLEGSAEERRTVGYYRSKEEALDVLGEHAQGPDAITPVDKAAIRARAHLQGANPNDSQVAQQLNRIAHTGIFDSLPSHVYRADLTPLLPPAAVALAGRRGKEGANCFNAVECAVGLTAKLRMQDDYGFSSGLEDAGYRRTASPRPGDIGLMRDGMGMLDHAFLMILTGANETFHWVFTKNGFRNENSYRYQRVSELQKDYDHTWIEYLSPPRRAGAR